MVVEMLETTDFFEEQITECKSAATHATNKNDREFWLKMAHRWEACSKRDKPPMLALKLCTNSGSSACDLQSVGALLSAVTSHGHQPWDSYGRLLFCDQSSRCRSRDKYF
jgi:hypothetical protein